LKNSINFKIIIIKNHEGIKSVKTRAEVDNMMKIKSQITSNFPPLSDERLYFLESHPSLISEIAVNRNMIIK